MKEKTVIYNNPLDGRMERYSGMAVTPDMVMEYLEYDIVKADEYLGHEAGKHPEKTILPDYIYSLVQEVKK